MGLHEHRPTLHRRRGQARPTLQRGGGQDHHTRCVAEFPPRVRSILTGIYYYMSHACSCHGEILSGNAAAGEKGNNRPHALTKLLGPAGQAAVLTGTRIIRCITDALGLPPRPPLEGVGASSMPRPYMLTAIQARSACGQGRSRFCCARGPSGRTWLRATA
eukprot:SAG31_NODE_1199_length_9431_cov_18.273789_10_plen_161_part_00